MQAEDPGGSATCQPPGARRKRAGRAFGWRRMPWLAIIWLHIPERTRPDTIPVASPPKEISAVDSPLTIELIGELKGKLADQEWGTE